MCRRCGGWRVRSLRGWKLPDRIRSAMTGWSAHSFDLCILHKEFYHHSSDPCSKTALITHQQGQVSCKLTFIFNCIWLQYIEFYPLTMYNELNRSLSEQRVVGYLNRWLELCRRCDGWRVPPLRGWNLPDRIRSIMAGLVPTSLISIYQDVLDGIP